jgi:hypothetical protein
LRVLSNHVIDKILPLCMRSLLQEGPYLWAERRMIGMKRFSLLLLLLLLAGCSPGRDAGGPITQPGSPISVYKPVDPALLQYDTEDLGAAGRVAHVTMRQGQRMPAYGRSLWGDREADRPKIAHILRLIRLAKPAERPVGTREGTRDEYETFMTVEYADGHLVQVGLVWQRLANGSYQSMPGRMYIPGVGEVVAPELDEFYRGVAKVRRIDLLVPVSPLVVHPQPAHPGSTVTIRGDGWWKVKRMSIFLLDSSTKRKQLLGEVQVEREAYVWQGALPQDLQPGVQPGVGWRYSIALEGDGVEVYRTTIEIAAP